MKNIIWIFRAYYISSIFFILFSLLTARLVQLGINYNKWASRSEKISHVVGNEGAAFAVPAMAVLGGAFIFAICLKALFTGKGGKFYAVLSVLIIAEVLMIYYFSF